MEKLASLPADTLPAEVTPRLGPEATGVGQIFWYALVPRLPDGTPDGTAFALHELRSIQDFSVKPALQSVPGVAEVASVGGFEREYHVEVDAERMRAHGVTLSAVVAAVRGSNLDVGARTLEVNQVEYVIRGVGFVERPEDLEEVVVGVEKHVPVRLSDVARIVYGPAPRRGALDDAGAPAVGGVVVARHGENPRAVIERVRARVAEISPGLPSRSTPQGLAKVEVDVFYDRAQLIDETLETLSTALWQQVLITIVVILALAGDVAVAVLVAASLPLGLLATFALMRTAGLEANLMSLAGIAIAIGTMVDVAIVLTESMAQRLREGGSNLSERVATGVVAVAPAVVTAALTTLVSFLPVFGLEASEGRLFRPLAWTKTMAVAASLVTGLTVLPVLARFAARWPGVPLGGAMTPARRRASWVLAAAAALALAARWSPFGPGVSSLVNAAGVILALLLGVGGAWLFLAVYPQLLRRSLTRPAGLLATAAAVLALGGLSLFGAPRGWGEGLNRAFPGLGREFMPPFDEGAFLYMPTTMPHASIGQSEELLASLDAAIAAVPEVDRAVGKLGRGAGARDP
ncbi:MAG: efflux RND transporter permease subunit, partial [Myxococcota bacterium]